MGRYIPPKHKPAKHLWHVEMIFDQARPLEVYSKLQVAETATEAMYIVLGMKKPKDITEVRCKMIAPSSYNLIKSHGRNTTQNTRYEKSYPGTFEGTKEFSDD